MSVLQEGVVGHGRGIWHTAILRDLHRSFLVPLSTPSGVFGENTPISGKQPWASHHTPMASNAGTFPTCASTNRRTAHGRRPLLREV